jgi:Fe-S cluster assembly iron-binding protein IscA
LNTTSQAPSASVDVSSASAAAGVVLTAAAIEKVQLLLEQEGRNDLRLRVAVQPGGCSGLRYELFFDDRLLDDDHVTRYGDNGSGIDA